MTVPNGITLFRVGLVPVFCVLVYWYDPPRDWPRWAAVAVYFAAGVSDALDGFVARRYHQKSRFGARLDPLADKLLVNLAYLMIAASPGLADELPHWFLCVPVIILFRDAIIVLGTSAITEIIGPREFRPNIVGKATTAFQMGTILVILLGIPYTEHLIAATAVLTLLSLVSYVHLGIHLARRRSRTAT